jgi:ATP-dependent DNA helicase RecQ
MVHRARSGDQQCPVLTVLRKYWGYDSLRPMQEAAVQAGLERRDALVIMPTGGGKSLCYQIPPLLNGELTVVVSPLIALMKDQVDGLRLIDYPAGCLHSGMEPADSNAVMSAVIDGSLRLLYVAPERLLLPGMLSRLAAVNNGRGPACFAIDEAHCISQWGHDFRPEYRRLSELRNIYPRAAFQAFTATATPRVREDILAQLQLREPQVLIGSFDRPNLTYRVVPKVDMHGQLEQIVRRHSDGATIVYAISRKTTEEIASELTRRGVEARAYHAGLDPVTRAGVQQAFAEEAINVVVATVAFGMGIDRGNVRCVVHAEMPKSIEHYQQETGRAGRDGLPSECVLLYSSGDSGRWKQILQRGAEEQGVPAAVLQRQFAFIDEVQRFATSTSCRHGFLAGYFGQEYQPPTPQGCEACDVCLGELDAIPDSTVIAQKILSCVARLAQHTPDLYFGAVHIVDVLRGSRRKQILDRGHDTLTTYGLLKDMGQMQLVSCLNQLIDMGYLRRSDGAYPVVSITAKAWDVLKSKVSVQFSAPRDPEPQQASGSHDEGCFQMLRRLRAKIASERKVSAYIIFSDASLQAMATSRPTTPESFSKMPAVGGRRLAEFGHSFCEAIADYCRQNSLATDLAATRPFRSELPKRSPTRGRKLESFDLFDKGMNLADVGARLGVAPTTACGYLVDYIEAHRPASVAYWVDSHAYAQVEVAAKEVGYDLLKPIYDHLDGQIGYDQIRVVLAHLKAVAAP